MAARWRPDGGGRSDAVGSGSTGVVMLLPSFPGCVRALVLGSVGVQMAGKLAKGRGVHGRLREVRGILVRTADAELHIGGAGPGGGLDVHFEAEIAPPGYRGETAG